MTFIILLLWALAVGGTGYEIGLEEGRKALCAELGGTYDKAKCFRSITKVPMEKLT